MVGFAGFLSGLFRTLATGLAAFGLAKTPGAIASPAQPEASRAESEAGQAGSEARVWIRQASGRAGQWQDLGVLPLPSSTLFVGDPSWGDDYHLRGAVRVPASQLTVYRYGEPGPGGGFVIWLEASGARPAGISGEIDFGMDSAYFALGDLGAGQDLARIGDLGRKDARDGFEFMLQHIQAEDFDWKVVPVPPGELPVFAVNTMRDGGLKAVLVTGEDGGFSGVMIDLRGREADGRYLDILLR